MTESQKILNFISEIRSSHSKMVDIFTKGSCLNFYFILRRTYNNVELFYNIEHVVSKINNRFYDIRGDVTKEVILDGKYKNISDFYSKKGVSRALKQMTRAEHKI